MSDMLATSGGVFSGLGTYGKFLFPKQHLKTKISAQRTTVTLAFKVPVEFSCKQTKVMFLFLFFFFCLHIAQLKIARKGSESNLGCCSEDFIHGMPALPGEPRHALSYASIQCYPPKRIVCILEH